MRAAAPGPRDGGQRHRIGFEDLCGARFVEPAGELVDRIGCDFALVEGRAPILVRKSARPGHCLHFTARAEDAQRRPSRALFRAAGGARRAVPRRPPKSHPDVGCNAAIPSATVLSDAFCIGGYSTRATR